MKNAKTWDVEIGTSGGLYPNMMESPELRWGFIRKVYLIVAMQILITIIIAAVMNIVPSIHVFFISRTSNSIILAFVIMILPFLGMSLQIQNSNQLIFDKLNENIAVMIPMVFLSDRHPVNMILLVVFTICMGMAVGLACSGRRGEDCELYVNSETGMG